MAQTLKIVHHTSLVTLAGTTVTSKQGATGDDKGTPFELSVTGTCEPKVGQLATATGRLLYDADSDFPITYLYGTFWADKDCYLQFLTDATEVTVPVTAFIPVTVPKQILASAGTTNLAAEPTLAAIDEISLWNESGSTLNFLMELFL